MVDPLFFAWNHMNILFVCLNVLFVKKAGRVWYAISTKDLLNILLED